MSTSASVCITESQTCELSGKPFALAITNATGLGVVAVVGWEAQLRGQLVRGAAIVKENITSLVYLFDVRLAHVSHRKWQQ
jgi:hypothetical protein